MDPVPECSELVRAAVNGDAAAWNALVDRYQPLVLSVVRSFRLRESDAQDVNQTVWLRLVERLGDLREPRALPGWLVTTTRNECVQVLREGRRTFSFDPLNENELADSATVIDLDEGLVQDERHCALLAAFAELSDSQRGLLVLLVQDPPLPYAEISRRLGIPIGGIGPTRARALARLRQSPAMQAFLDSRELDGQGGGPRGAAALGR